jgi:hypothetical protein
MERGVMGSWYPYQLCDECKQDCAYIKYAIPRSSFLSDFLRLSIESHYTLCDCKHAADNMFVINPKVPGDGKTIFLLIKKIVEHCNCNNP